MSVGDSLKHLFTWYNIPVSCSLKTGYMGLVRERLRTVKYPSINRLARTEVAKTKLK